MSTRLLLLLGAAVTLLFLPMAKAAFPQLTYTYALLQDTNVTANYAPLGLTTLVAPSYANANGTPPNSVRFTAAGVYKVQATYFVIADQNVQWGFGIGLDLGPGNSYSPPTITTPMTFTSFLGSTTTYIAVLTVDQLFVGVGDTVWFGLQVRPTVANQTYINTPKVYHGLANTNLSITAL